MVLSIDKDVMQKVLDYLITKPYREVALILNDVQKSLKPIPEPEPKIESDK